MSLRGAKKIPSLCSEQAVQSHKKGVIHPYEIAALPAVARNDKNKI
jgi:hypothetical protein